ncbi:uncharacterized protein LOC108860768 [Raphanus sativus]|uniref:Uncharacterized protein LOC108860768 n=1 Tax=Raphanus sativus TaxID=3726 RepID=A0A9W3DUA4_RAPSA|nr:uncharacterized protein LOC108860768 [Raphanus sativus]
MASQYRFVRTGSCLESLNFASVVICRFMGSQYKRHSSGGFPMRKQDVGVGFFLSKIYLRSHLSLHPALRTAGRGSEAVLPGRGEGELVLGLGLGLSKRWFRTGETGLFLLLMY